MNVNRLRWASRRGMLELDLILLPFLDNVFDGLSEQEQQLYEKLLTCEDQDLFAWFLRREEPTDPEIKTIVNIVRSHTGVQGQA